MAVRHGYGKVAGADALVFAYDTGDTRNSYKGEPTTNLVTNPTFAGDSLTGWTSLGNPTVSNGVATLTGLGPDTGLYIYQDLNFSASTITISYEARTQNCNDESGNGDSGPRIRFDGVKVNLVLDPSTEWTRYTHTVSHDGSGRLEFSGHDMTAGSVLQVRNIQVEQKSHATPFTAGTRSVTQGLLDLTGNSSIDLSDVSFDSNAQMYFDGTDEIMLLEKLITTQDFTVEQVIYEESFSDEGWTFEQYVPDSGRLIINSDTVNRLRFFIGGSAVTSPNSIPLNSYHHIVCVREDGVGYIYENGVLTASGGISTATIPDTTAAVGGSRYFTSNKQFNGEIPVTKVYNRALTAAEIKNNYRNYKGRFNI